MTLRLKVFSARDPEAVRTFAPESGAPFVIGREDGVDCQLSADSKVSRRHGVIEPGPDGVPAIRDLGSTNGLRVNGTLYGGRRGRRNADGTLPAVPLRSGDTVRIGGFTIAVELADGPGIDAAIPESSPAAAPSVPPAPCDGGGDDDGDGERFCDKCGDPIHADSVVVSNGRVLCLSCRLLDDEAVTGAIPIPGGGDGEAPPPRISGYRITRQIGQGGLGRVYHAYRDGDGGEVAIKVLSMNPTPHTSDLLFFKRETDIMRSLRHGNIVTFYDSGHTRGLPYVVMEYMGGGPLSRLMRRRGHLPAAEALAIIRQVLAALAVAHGRGVIHRDVKPLNVLLDGEGKNPVVKLTDFGLAKSFLAAGLSGFTKTGTSFGSLNYLPPEQIHDYKRVTPAADVFAVGAIFYELLSGKSPYMVKDGDYMAAVINHSVTPLTERCPKLPRKLAGLVDRALSREPVDRFADAAEMLAALA